MKWREGVVVSGQSGPEWPQQTVDDVELNRLCLGCPLRPIGSLISLNQSHRLPDADLLPFVFVHDLLESRQ
jgi:hypothetical protein